MSEGAKGLIFTGCANGFSPLDPLGPIFLVRLGSFSLMARCLVVLGPCISLPTLTRTHV